MRNYYAAIRRYKLNEDMSPEVLRSVLESFVPLVRETVIACYVLDTGDGTLATISICEDEEKVETTNRVATVPGRPRGQKRGNIRTIAGVATKLMGEWRKGQSMSEQGLPETRAERTRPYAPGYGIPSNPRGMLPWSFVEERMTAARNYWVATVLPSGGPHLTPVWGLWVEGVFYFGSGPQTRKARNVAGNPHIAVHPEGDDVVIVEGVAETVTDPGPALAELVSAASRAKYGMGSRNIEGSYAVRPRVVFAWTASGFPNTATRWAFD